MAIIGVLAAVGIPLYQGHAINSKITATKEIHVRAKGEITAGFAKCSAKVGSIMLDRYSHGTGEYAKGIPEKVDCGEFWKYKASSWAHIFGDHFNNSGNTNPYDPTSIFPQAFWYLPGKNPEKGRTHNWYSDDRTLTLITNIGTEDGTDKIITSSMFME